MDINLIKKICGVIPENFVKVVPGDSNYVFTNDPNFTAINLYDFFGRAATVNSFTECFYYVELGFEPVKTTIFDIAFVIIAVSLLILTFLFIQKKNYFVKFNNFFKEQIIKLNVKDIVKNERFVLMMSVSYLVTSYFYLYDYVRTKSLRIPRFIDEYITLTSNVNFFSNLNFNAGDFIGGNYSVQITSGPLSAIGGVVAWNITEKLIITRMASFLWVYLLQIFFVYLIYKAYKVDVLFLLLVSGLALVLIPWWQGSLYSIGEIVSSLFFLNAILLFSKFRKFSLILFSLSVFYGKLLNLVPFAGFYLAILIYEKKLKNIYKDGLTFISPLIPWLFLVHFKYENGSILRYLSDQISFITNHQSSGISDESDNFVINFLSSLEVSEFSSWNIYDKSRLLFIPLLFSVFIYRNRDNINDKFGNIAIPLISSNLFIFTWFWLLNSTKWIRHTQHFIVPIIFVSLYIISSSITINKFDIAIFFSILFLFINNNKNLIYYSLFFILIFTIFAKKEIITPVLKLTLLIVLLLDIAIPYFEKEKAGDINYIIEECQIDIQSDQCREEYLNQ
tara:strand:+ start:3791 stop:5479 length:1689 start_codon:yes stop_codon:yes gene_type:complete